MDHTFNYHWLNLYCLIAPYHSLEETNIIDVSINAIVEIVMNIMFVHYF
ncbi:hypothetical protein SRABI133_04121 [Peribacillus simplex]|jgi:hypothetical protein|uniref:Uncharacterized protein n=1 Tax=Peribacillus simplex TaxID=1478 RepID=A0A9W4L1D8_9BACI|nr:hypothetical protein SRABI133_04121 [Peribacillus simplex]